MKKIQKEICECESAMEMAGYLDGINAVALIYCKKEHPDEVSIAEDGKSEIEMND